MKSKTTLDEKIFKNIKYSDLTEEIYNEYKDKKEMIDDVISQIVPFISEKSDAIHFTPIIKSYLDAGAKNSSNMIMLMSILQKMLAKEAGDVDKEMGGLEKELSELLKNSKSIKLP